MKYQIALVGGQILPIYIGIKEFQPDFVYFVASEESRPKLSLLLSSLNLPSSSQHFCDPYQFSEIRELCVGLVEKLAPTDEVSFNLTSGTKVMVLALQSLIQDGKGKGFYINPDSSIIELPSYHQRPLTCSVTVNEIIGLSGHSINKYNSVTDFKKEDFDVANDIMSFCANDYRYKVIVGHIFNVFKRPKVPVPPTGQLRAK